MSQDSAIKEVVITGVGVVTPLDSGKGTQDFWDKLCGGTNAIRPIRGFNVEGHKCNVGGEIFEFESFLKDYWKKEQNRCTKLFALACQYALQDATVDSSLMQTMGIAVGNILGDMVSGEKYMNRRVFLSQRSDENLLKQYCLNTVADSIAKGFSMNGPAVSINTACCSGADAIRSAASQICNSRRRIMIAGGVDLLSEFVFRGFSALNALTTDGKVCPFDKGRKGLALGEGAGVVVLEERNHARKRGAKIYCKFSSSGSSSDAYNLVKPQEEGQGLSRAINTALFKLKGKSDDIDYICAHGTGTLYNDIMETKAIKQVFGEKAYMVRVSSIKSMIGHTLGAASAIEVVNCVKVIENNIIPPTINFEEPDPECDLQYVLNTAVKKTVNTCMSLSAGFGGQNTALIFSRVQS